jgi:hygromycin-B 7''-O-kinase
MNKDSFQHFPIFNSIEEYGNLKSTHMDFFLELVKKIIHNHHWPQESLSLYEDGTNMVFSYGETHVLKLFPPLHEEQFQNEILVLKHLTDKLRVKTPRIEFSGNMIGWSYIMMSKLEGILLETLWESISHANKLILLQEIGALIREVHRLPIQELETIDPPWTEFINDQLRECANHHGALNFPKSLLKQLPDYLNAVAPYLFLTNKPVLLTGEYTPMNLLVKKVQDTWHLCGMFDFGDAMLGLPEYDLLGPGAFLIQGNKELLRTFLLAYGFSVETLNKKLSHQLTALMLLHRYSNLNVQIRILNWREKVKSLEDLENLVWGMCDNG